MRKSSGIIVSLLMILCAVFVLSAPVQAKKNSTSPISKKSSNAEKDDGATGQAVKEVGTENNENIDEESSLKEGTDEDQESTEEKDTGQ